MSGFERLEDVVQDDRFVEADLRLRRSHHLGREDPDLYAFVLDALELLEHLYERFGARLVHRTDGYFFLVPIGDRLSRRQLTPGEMLVGQALALHYLDPATLRDNGVVDRSAVLRRLDGLLGIEALFRKLVPIRHARGAALPVADPQPPHETSDGSTHEAASTVGHELRLAIVMHGSVSLAIYMNGVAQELLNLVRATAGGGTDAGTAGIDDSGATKGTDAEAALAHVYREAAQHL